jgi:hypothetical protein
MPTVLALDRRDLLHTTLALQIPYMLNINVPMDTTFNKAQVGRRLRSTMEALGLTRVEVACALDGSLGNWLRGGNDPSAWFVTRFCIRYGVMADSVYRGIVSGVTSETAETLWESDEMSAQRGTAE